MVKRWVSKWTMKIKPLDFGHTFKFHYLGPNDPFVEHLNATTLKKNILTARKGLHKKIKRRKGFGARQKKCVQLSRNLDNKKSVSYDERK